MTFDLGGGTFDVAIVEKRDGIIGTNPAQREPATVNDCLDEVEGLVRALAAGWKPDPPRAAFDQRDEDALDLEVRLLNCAGRWAMGQKLPSTQCEDGSPD